MPVRAARTGGHPRASTETAAQTMLMPVTDSNAQTSALNTRGESGGARRAPPDIQAGFDRLKLRLERLRAGAASGALAVTVSPAFAAKWLLPRFERFQAMCPDTDVRLETSLKPVDFVTREVDIGVRDGPGTWPRLMAGKLMDEEVSRYARPRCSWRTVPCGNPTTCAACGSTTPRPCCTAAIEGRGVARRARRPDSRWQSAALPSRPRLRQQCAQSRPRHSTETFASFTTRAHFSTSRSTRPEKSPDVPPPMS